MSKYLNLEESGRSYDQEFVCSGNPRQNIWNKVEKIDKNRTGEK